MSTSAAAPPGPPPGRLLEVGVPVATLWSSPGAPRPVDAPATVARPDPAAWPAVLDAGGRLGLHGRVLTQALLGEPVQVLAGDGEWAQVVLPWQAAAGSAGYPGWMRRDHLADPVTRRAGTTAALLRGPVRCRLDEGAALHLSFGNVLAVDVVTADEVAVLLPAGRRGWLPRAEVRLATGHPAAGRPAARGATGEAVVAAGRRLVGLGYLWGGLSSWGVDCSGLVHLAYRALGVALPRDASEQAADPARIEPIAPRDTEVGDLYFFARPASAVHHVGIAVPAPGSAQRMLHAPERDGRGQVEEVDLGVELRSLLVGAGRVRR